MIFHSNQPHAAPLCGRHVSSVLLKSGCPNATFSISNQNKEKTKKEAKENTETRVRPRSNQLHRKCTEAPHTFAKYNV